MFLWQVEQYRYLTADVGKHDDGDNDGISACSDDDCIDGMSADDDDNDDLVDVDEDNDDDDDAVVNDDW